MRHLREPGGPRRSSARASLPVTLILLAPMLLNACKAGDKGGSARPDSTATPSAADSSNGEDDSKQEKSISVDAAEVWRGDLVIPVSADGTIRTPLAGEVRAKVGGELDKVYVRDGDTVKRGQLLAQIDPREYTLALEESRLRYLGALGQAAADADTTGSNAQAGADFEQQRDELEGLQRKGGLSRDEYHERLVEMEMRALQQGVYRREMFEHRTGLAEARIDEERAHLNLDHTRITAPFSGMVEGVAVVEGGIVAAGSLVCRVVNNEHLEASVRVLEADLGDLREGRPALVMVPATNDTIHAQVDVISPLLDEASRTCQVLIRFDNPQGRLRAGMFARSHIAGFIHPDKLMVPVDALLTRDDRALVFKVSGDRAQWLYVETGLRNDQWVEITSVASGGSLSPGDRVVVSDHLTLAHEAKIKVRKTRQIRDRWAVGASVGITP